MQKGQQVRGQGRVLERGNTHQQISLCLRRRHCLPCPEELSRALPQQQAHSSKTLSVSYPTTQSRTTENFLTSQSTHLLTKDSTHLLLKEVRYVVLNLKCFVSISIAYPQGLKLVVLELSKFLSNVIL